MRGSHPSSSFERSLTRRKQDRALFCPMKPGLTPDWPRKSRSWGRAKVVLYIKISYVALTKSWSPYPVYAYSVPKKATVLYSTVLFEKGAIR